MLWCCQIRSCLIVWPPSSSSSSSDSRPILPPGLAHNFLHSISFLLSLLVAFDFSLCCYFCSLVLYLEYRSFFPFSLSSRRLSSKPLNPQRGHIAQTDKPADERHFPRVVPARILHHGRLPGRPRVRHPALGPQRHRPALAVLLRAPRLRRAVRPRRQLLLVPHRHRRQRRLPRPLRRLAARLRGRHRRPPRPGAGVRPRHDPRSRLRGPRLRGPRHVLAQPLGRERLPHADLLPHHRAGLHGGGLVPVPEAHRHGVWAGELAYPARVLHSHFHPLRRRLARPPGHRRRHGRRRLPRQPLRHHRHQHHDRRPELPGLYAAVLHRRVRRLCAAHPPPAETAPAPAARARWQRNAPRPAPRPHAPDAALPPLPRRPRSRHLLHPLAQRLPRRGAERGLVRPHHWQAGPFHRLRGRPHRRRRLRPQHLPPRALRARAVRGWRRAQGRVGL